MQQFKFKKFFANPERAEKFLEYDDNERKTNDDYLLNVSYDAEHLVDPNVRDC